MSRLTIGTIPQDGDGPARFLGAVQAAAEAFLLTEPDPIKDLGPEDYNWLHSVTRGRVGSLFEILALAAHEAVGIEERLTPDLLRLAYNLLNPEP